MKIAIAGGHSKAAPGASGFLDEYQVGRAYVAKLIDPLRYAGYEVVDCSNEEATASAELARECQLANASKADVFVVFHFNAGGGTGTECWYYGDSVEGHALAARLSANVAAALGLRDRGPKSSTGLYVLKHTEMTAVLLEVCFVDTATDKAAWDGTSWDALTGAVVEALGGVTKPAEPAPAPSPAPDPVPSAPFGGRYVVKASTLNIRDRPSLSGSVVGTYNRGATVVLDDDYTIADGYVWGQYMAYSGHRRYVAVGKATGKPEPGDYLVKE